MSEMHTAGEKVLLADPESPRAESLDDFEHLAVEDFPTLSDDFNLEDFPTLSDGHLKDFKLVDEEEVSAFPSTNSPAELIVPEMQSHLKGVTESQSHSPPSIVLPESAMAADDPAFQPDFPSIPGTNSPAELLVPTMQSHVTKSKSHSPPSIALPETPTAVGSDDPKQKWDVPSPPKRPRLSPDDVQLVEASATEPSIEATTTADEPDSSRVASVPTTIEPTASTSSAVRTLRVSGLPPKGLENLGYSCYFNSVLQCLIYIPPFGRHCINQRHLRTCSLRGEKNCFLCLMEVRVKSNLCQASDIGWPGKLYNEVVNSNQFTAGEQEDAHELLGFLISKSTDTYKLRHSRFNASYLERLFTGKTRTSITCSQCREVSTRDEDTLCHSLSISGVDCLAGAFAKECSKELLDGENKYRCERCNDLSEAEKQTWIHEQPQVLSVHLKRFDDFGRKMFHHLEFPEQFSLADYMESTTNPVFEYKLCGVVIHIGPNRLEGHYVACVKETNGKWYVCDDEQVDEVTKEFVLRTNAYILFYNKESSSNNLEE